MPTIAFTIIGHNESENLPRALESVSWADQLVYVDCQSADNSLEIALRYTELVFSRLNLPNLNINKAFAIDQATTDWVFYLDADEEITPRLGEEIRRVIGSNPRDCAFRLPRRNLFFGTWLRRGGQYPDHQLRLFRRGMAHFPLEHIHEKLDVSGTVGTLREPMDHHTVDTPATAIRKMDFNSTFNAMDMAARGQRPTMGMALRFLVFKPLNRFLRRYLLKGGFLDGWPGLAVAVIDSIDFQFRFIKFWYWSAHPETRPDPQQGREDQ